MRDIAKLLNLYDSPKPHWPLLCGCGVCEGISGAYQPGETFTPEEAYVIALLQHGWYIQGWQQANVANRTLIPTRCTCAKFLEDHLPKYKTLLILLGVKDSGWHRDGGDPSRGDHFFARTMTFTRKLTDEERDLVVEVVSRQDAPGRGAVCSHSHCDETGWVYWLVSASDSSG